ncbi:MAG: Uma2 family endonuclease, partial [bacterium]|nr:Uma2 family endonuclease [bacterium]
VVDYLNAGAVVWLVDPAARTIEVYTPGQSPKLLKPGDTLDGGAILPGLTLSIQQVFDELDAD